MSYKNWTAVSGSHRKPMPGAQYISPVKGSDEVKVTLILRRAGGAPHVAADPGQRPRLTSREQYAQTYGADLKDIEAIEEFAHVHGLTVVERHHEGRRVVLKGSADQMQQAFQVKLGIYDVPARGFKYRGREGDVCLPQELQPIVLAVLGLDNRPVAKPHFQPQRRKGTIPVSYTPLQVAQLYDFPTSQTGQGQTIAIIELGGGYQTADLDTYFAGLGLGNGPSVTAISVDGGMNTPGGDADGEVMLDIEVAGAVAPGANIAVYFAPNTDQGFVDAITQAVHDTARTPSVVSISWGAAEDAWTAQSRDAMNAAMQDAAALGVTITVAAGDNGSSDGETDGQEHVDFPSASPYALACGGTTLQAKGNAISSETVWNETAHNEGSTGGGVSRFFAIPAYQGAASVPKQPQTNFAGRGVPDVAGDADPVTGYKVRVDGKDTVIGGTSAVAPLWAGLIALMNEQIGKPVGFLNPAIYALKAGAFHDITSGNNGFFKAAKGWDACTGLGTPIGAALLQALQGTAVAATTK